MDVFTPEEDEKLIQLVSQFPILYDTKHADFKEQHLKDNIWRDITKELNKSGETCCKRHWRNIRDGYARFKRCKSATTDGPKNPRIKWQFYKLLSFLDTVAQEKSPTSNVEETSKNNDTNSQDYTLQTEFINIDSPGLNKTATDAVESITEASTTHLNEPRKRRRITDTDGLNSLIDYLKQRDEARQSTFGNLSHKNNTNEDIESFSVHVKNVLEKLPTVLQINAKKEIFDVLYKYEIMGAKQAKTPNDNSASDSRNFNCF